MEFKKLEKELYDIANNMVDNIAPNVKGCPSFYTSRWHAFGLFCIIRKSPDYSEIVNVWTKWVRAYCDFKKLHTPESTRIIENPDLTICWLGKPVVEVREDYLSHVTDKATKSEGALIKAYLAIYRTDCDLYETVTECQRCKEIDKALAGSNE